MASNNLNLGYDPSRKNLGYDPTPSVTKKDDEEWGYFDRLKFNLTRPIRNLVNTTRYTTVKAQKTINEKTGRENTTPNKSVDVFSPIPSYTVQQLTPNSNINKTAETLYDATKETGKNVVKAGKDFVKNPGQSIKSIGVGAAEGIDSGIDTITDAKNDFLDFITFGAYKKSNPMYIRSEMHKENPYSLQNQYKKTETFQDKQSGNLSEEQQNIYQIGQNVGNMIPSIAVSTVAGPTAGSAVFFVQSQQSYTEEAKKRGYSDIEARTYGLVMGGAEVIVERIGFDELGGLNKLSKGSVLKSMGGEALEEFVMPYIDSTVKTAYGEEVNWNDTIYESVESAVYGAVIGGLMNLGGKGLSKVDVVVNKINNNQTVTSEEMSAALEEVKNSNPNYFNEIIEGLDQQIISEIEQKMNTQQKTAETKVPTVQEVVAQEKNSVTVLHKNTPGLNTSKTGSDTSSFSDNNIAQVNEGVNSNQSLKLPIKENDLSYQETIKQTKGNIPINIEVLDKYSTVREIFDNELNNFNGEVKVVSNLKEFDNINLEQISITESKKIADDIFKKYNTTSEFINNGNKIVVNKSGINESVEKIFNNRKQRNLLKQHLQVFSDLGDIIEKAKLVNQTQEHKGRKNIKLWNYYYNGLNIDGETYNLVFDVRSMENGENQYRVQRLERVIKKTGDYDGDVSNNTKILPPYSQPVSDNNIAQIDKNVKLPIVNTNNMQNNENNTKKILNPNEISKLTQKDANTTPILPTKKVSTGRGESNFAKNIENNTNNMSSLERTAPPIKNTDKNQLGYIPKDPTKASSYDIPEKVATILEERPITVDEKERWLKKLLTIKILDKGYYVDKLARQKNNKELSSKYDYMLMANGIAQQVIGNEQFNPRTQKSTGEGLYKIFEPIENSGKLQEFSEYMYHKHNISRMSLDTNYKEDNKPIFGDSIDAKYSKDIVEKYESENPEFIEWSEKIYDYNNFLLDVLVDYGVISKDDKTYYNKKYPYYVPTIRVTDKTKVQMDFIGKKASVNVPIKTAKGGNQDIIPLKEAMVLRTMQTMNSALRNNFGNELLNTINPEVETVKISADEVIGDELDVEELLTKSTKKSSATLTVFKNGEKVTFDINDEIYEALAPSNRYKIKNLNSISKFRRAVTTEFSPAFMLTNPIKDIQDGALNSKHPTLFIKNIPEAISQVKNKGEFYKLYMANGGGYETYFNYGEGYNKIPQKRKIYDPRKILDKISEINQEIEMTPRIAEFMASLEAGDNVETSVYNSQEITTNFKRGGDWTKNLDANGATFLNAGVQGTVKQVRNIQEAKVQGIRGMTNLVVKWSIAGLIPYILSQLVWGDDDDYEELSDYVKNNYYILWKNEDGTFVRIPKGRVTSVIQNLFKQPLDALQGEKIDTKEFLDLLQNQVLPNDPTESNIISPIIDVMQNKTWYGGDLVPQRLQSLPEEEQYDESTDAISIWMGKKTGISPIKINYILDQYSGAIGDVILPALTLEAENDSNTLISYLTAPLKDKFTTNSVMNNQNISDLYDLDDELTKKAKSSNATSKDILKSKYINTIQNEMNKLTKEQRNIQMDKHLTNNEKYKQVKEIQKKINQLAKKGLNNYENITSYSNYGKVAEEEYYLNSKNEWTKVNDKEKESLSNIKMNDTDKNKYFKTKVQIGIIKSDDNKESIVKHTEIANLVINSGLSDEYKGYLYGKYYSSEKVIKSVLDARIKIDEFIKFNSQEFTTDYSSNGRAITNSRRNKVIKYINSLNLSIPQKAILIKMEYSSYDKYDSQIVSYINKQNLSKFEKASLLKSFGFDTYDKYLIQYVNNLNITKSEKKEMLEDMGFTVRNGRVYA